MATNEVAEKYMFVVFATEEENSCSLLVTNGSVGLTPYFLLPVAVFVTSRVVCSSHPRCQSRIMNPVIRLTMKLLSSSFLFAS